MKTLVIGAAGFVGSYLIRELENFGDIVTAADTAAALPVLLQSRAEALGIDILQRESIEKVLSLANSERVILLAAQSSVRRSWEDPAGTIETNVVGSVNVLEAIRASNRKVRVLLIGSAEEYGDTSNSAGPIGETRPLAPANPYAITKSCQEDFGKLYCNAYAMDIVLVRAFNHIGPGQRPGFVIPDFCSSIAKTERGEQEPLLKIGNLDAMRDFTDVRDIVRAYRLLLEKGKSGEVYNVGSGLAIPISQLLAILIGMSKLPIHTEIDPNKYRPIDIKCIVADISKLKDATKWHPEISLKKSLTDSLEYWRLQQ